MVARTRHSSSDEDFMTADEESHIAETTYSNISEAHEDTDSDSDEAPEEEGFGNARQNVARLEEEQARIEQQEKAKLREKRRLQDSKLKEQKQNKKQKHSEIPDLLPQSLLDDIANESRTKTSSSSGIRTVFNDESEEMSDAELDKQLRAAKAKIAKHLNKKSKKIGGVKVRLVEKKQVKLPPAATPGHTATLRNKWLKRRSLQKKRTY